MKCENCSNEATINQVQKYRYTESGLDNVFLDNINVYFCKNCEFQVPIIPKVLLLHKTIGFAIIAKKSLLSGAEAKYLRKQLRIKAQDWAKVLRSKKETISRWESGAQNIGLQSDLLIRYLYLRLMEERLGIQSELKITENLSEYDSDETAIIIDIKRIEDFSYMLLADVLRSDTTEDIQIKSLELDESNEFLGGIELPLGYEHMRFSDQANREPFSKQQAANQELSLAA